jgi:arabinogalactan oligomer/maltooligosaccharide transport system substrate-binding protein
MKRHQRILALLAGVAILAAACTTNTGTPAPPTAAPPTGSAPTTGPEPTDATLEGRLVVWHAYGSSGGNAEFKAFSRLIENLKAENPGLDIQALDVPFNDIFNKFQTESAAGGGPDMFIAPNDPFGDMVRGGFLVDLTGRIDDVLAVTSDVAIAGSTVDGKIYMVPESLKSVAMYYDSEKVPNPPKTTAELLAFVQGGGKVGVIDGAYFGWGFYNGFGGKIFDETGKCAATANSGVADAIQFVADLKKAGALVDADYGKVNDAFLNGEVDIIFNGNWTLGDYQAARPALAVAPVPAGPGGASATMTGTDGWYINSSSSNVDLAIAAAKWLVSQSSQEVYVDVAGHVPANKNINIIDPLVAQFAVAIYEGDARPQSPEFSNYWGNFGDAWRQVLDTGADAAAAVAKACADMDTANNK